MTPISPLPHPSLSRRQFIGVAASVGGVAVTGLGGAQLVGWITPVVGFHADTPYLDQTGMTEPFRPRIGVGWVDGLDSEAILRLGHTI
ncbi:MAG: twin-arginine translocation signal domain-containing protein [Pseudomonadota bacterium]